jgi:GNAT superfamily N-acetyltransferase
MQTLQNRGKKLVRSTAYRWRHGGTASVLAGFGRTVRSSVYRTFDAVAYLADDLNMPPNTPAGITVGHLTYDDLIQGRHFKTLAYPELIRTRFDEGHLCIGVYCDGSLAHVAWLSLGRVPIDTGIPEIVAEGLGGVFDGFTLPEFRGRGCLTFAVQEMCTEGFRLGLTRVLAVIHADNGASRHVHEKLGFRYIGEIRYRRILWTEHFDHPLV